MHPTSQMKTRNNSCCIARRADQQGVRPPGQDSPGIEKYATESTSSTSRNPLGHQDGKVPTPGPAAQPSSNNNQKKTRRKWTREEYTEVMYCFYYALEKPETNNTDDTYNTWCLRNSDSEKTQMLDPSKLANVSRYIVRSKKLTELEISIIKDRVKNDTREVQIEGNGNEGNLDEQELELPNNVDLADENNVDELDPHEVVVDEEELLAMKTDIIEELSVIKHTEMNQRETLLKIRHPYKYKTMLEIGNKALEQLCHDMTSDLTELNELIYATGKVLQTKCGIKSRKRKTKRKSNKAKWQVKIEKEIESFRREISILEELQKDNQEKIRKSEKSNKKIQNTFQRANTND